LLSAGTTATRVFLKAVSATSVKSNGDANADSSSHSTADTNAYGCSVGLGVGRVEGPLEGSGLGWCVGLGVGSAVGSYKGARVVRRWNRAPTKHFYKPHVWKFQRVNTLGLKPRLENATFEVADIFAVASSNNNLAATGIKVLHSQMASRYS
jgi:hypothetical protein